jgi:colanic acid biosynthesis protein WcaH
MSGFCLIKIILEADMLPLQSFKLIVESTPLISLDLIVRGADERVLLGKRINRPAQGYWFVPGGRILKNETVNSTFMRLLDEELGLRSEDVSSRALGIYEHFYPDNFTGGNFGTHYVVVAYEVNLSEISLSLPKNQHSHYKWFESEEILQSHRVHKYTKWYFMNNKHADCFVN